MGEVLPFPTKKQLPEQVENSLYEIAKAYVDTLVYALMVLSDDASNLKELDEIRDLVNETYLDGLIDAITKMETPSL